MTLPDLTQPASIVTQLVFCYEVIGALGIYVRLVEFVLHRVCMYV